MSGAVRYILFQLVELYDVLQICHLLVEVADVEFLAVDGFVNRTQLKHGELAWQNLEYYRRLDFNIAAYFSYSIGNNLPVVECQIYVVEFRDWHPCSLIRLG